MKKVITIIVTFNGEKWIKKCLTQLTASAYSTKILVIDNNSGDSTREIIKQNFSGVELLEEEVNLGFGQANNKGILYGIREQFDYFFLLNQDAYIFPETIGSLVKISETCHSFGIISPLQFEGTGKQLDPQFKTYIVNNYDRGFADKLETGSSDKAEPFPLRFVNAASWFISRNCILKAGLFHPVFFHYGEDNNYSSRVQYHGFKVGVTPDASVIHDRFQVRNSFGLLKRKIETVPLYTLMDIRKGLIPAVFLAFWKLAGCWVKGLRKKDKEIRKLSVARCKWMVQNLRGIIKARNETKIPFPKIIDE